MRQKQCSCCLCIRVILRNTGGIEGFVCVIATHMALEGREVNVRDEQDRLGLEVVHHLEDGDVVALLEDGHFDVHDWEENTEQGEV